MKMGFISVVLLCLFGNAQAGLFDTMDSVGAIQSKNSGTPNREPAAAPNAIPATSSEEQSVDEPNAVASQEAQKTEAPRPSKTKKKSKH